MEKEATSAARDQNNATAEDPELLVIGTDALGLALENALVASGLSMQPDSEMISCDTSETRSDR